MKHGGWLFALAVAAAWAQAPTAWTPELQMRVKTIGTAVPSPDGKLVAYTETRAVMETEKSEMETQIFLARADGSHRFQLTRGDKSAGSPVFSPDSRFVYFKSERSGKPNVWRIAVDGGEAEMLTDWKGSLGQHQVSPDGKWVAVTGRPEDEEKEKAKKEKRDFQVVDESSETHSLWLIPAEADAEGKRAARKLFDAAYHVAGFDWAPDSRRIAFSHQPTPKADDWTRSDLSEVEVEGGHVAALASSRAAESDPRYSPDGRYLAYRLSSDPPRWADEERIAVIERGTGASRSLAPTYDERPQIAGWSADSSRVLFLESRHTQSGVYAMPLDGSPATVHLPAAGVLGGVQVNRTGTHASFAWEDATSPPEAFLMALGGGQAVRVSRTNAELPGLPLGRTEVIRWKAQDGLEIEGLLTYPVAYEAGRRVPLILNIHGGPAGVFAQNFIGRPGIYPLAALAARGFAILRPNPRGSGGYGKKFRFANLADWGGKDYGDLMAGVDHVVGMGVADPERLAVMGWSYGGFMTSWVIGQTQRFKAAVVGAGVTNLWSFTGTADIPGFLPDYFAGEPWENFEAYRLHSPMSHVGAAATPTLILHGEADIRVPISQGHELYNALKRRGVTAKMVTYPRMPHGPNEPKFMLDIMRRHVEWVEKYVP
jgi:dipeptidyl aminopeptidase/acylaminoacyl peptidase